jgi:hypothetical protein
MYPNNKGELSDGINLSSRSSLMNYRELHSHLRTSTQELDSESTDHT